MTGRALDRGGRGPGHPGDRPGLGDSIDGLSMRSQNELDRATAEGMLLALLAYVRHVMGEGPRVEIRDLIHPQAEMRLFVSFRKPLKGRAAVVDALEHGKPAVVFRAGDLRFEWLDDATALG